jgi:hypothetical protein
VIELAAADTRVRSTPAAWRALHHAIQPLDKLAASHSSLTVNYRIHTDAIKERLIPPQLTKAQTGTVYASEADLLNVALKRDCHHADAVLGRFHSDQTAGAVPWVTGGDQLQKA